MRYQHAMQDRSRALAEAMAALAPAKVTPLDPGARRVRAAGQTSNARREASGR